MGTTGLPTLPFGKYKGRRLSEVPGSYLAWLLREAKLSTGLRFAVRAELLARGVAVPPAPPPKPLGPCPRCGGHAVLATWYELRDGRRAIRATCSACAAHRGFLPETAENVALADAARPAAPLLDALVQADQEGVELVVTGGRVEPHPYRLASLRLRDLVRQSQHSLLRHLRGD
jgi:hypothetical protein